ncbi:hypothetical protein [Plebeiibacterium sediminum]|uniref:Alpha/beta hydrolase n=1 Tax=Plebeiibacterium sediminum TaxID=2992112 RepID=A0AAE3M1T0_9BACT|nr:hypothetical protein [Plebeiobacterium sediminum]MCW3785564.1 hypothetical protein [Plebeiobacterium sediminum]
MIISKHCIIIILLSFIWQITFAQDNAPENPFLPEPTGKYAVGTESFILRDTTAAKKKNQSRISIKIWYPAIASQKDSHFNKYLDGYDLNEIYRLFKAKGVTKEDIEKLASYSTYSAQGLQVSNDQEEFPVIIFTPGYYFGLNDIYSAYIENLASNGYIVCAITHINQQISIKAADKNDNALHTARSSLPFLQWWWVDKINFKDHMKSENQVSMSKYFLKRLKRFNKVLKEWEGSTLFLIDYLRAAKENHKSELYTRMNLDEVGAMGQSFGGALANHLCVSYDFIKAGVNLDCFQFGDVANTYTNKPLMLIESEQQIKWRIANEYIYKDYNHLEYARIKGGKHFLFTDLPYYNVILDDEKLDELIGEVDGQKAIEWMNSIILSFFEEGLKNGNNAHVIERIDNDEILYQKSNKCIYLK